METSLIIPCFNEEGNIDTLVKKCETYLENQKNQLVLVNNGSTDSTEKKIDQHLYISNILKVNVEKNEGFGHGVLEGLKMASGKVLSYTHADLQTDPNDVLEGIKLHKDKNDCNFFIKGKRVNKIKNNWSILDLFISYSMTLFESLLFQKLLHDIHAQPVIFHRNFYKLWISPPKDMTFDVYTYYLAKQKRYKITRFPVDFNKLNRLSGTGNNETIKKTIKGSLEHIISSLNLRLKIK